MGDAQTANASPPAPPAASFFQPLHPLGTWCDFNNGNLVEGVNYMYWPDSIPQVVTLDADRGADLQYLSAFPAEAEVLFPPLTFLRPTGVTTHKQFGLASFTVIEVEPRLGT